LSQAPKLSLIIPTFNSKSTIERCLQSIAVQTFTDYEVIVQDGSPNGKTVRIIEEFQQAHSGLSIRLYHEPDRGVYDAMNKAMARAQGEWFYYLGSNDELFDKQVLAAVLATPNIANCEVLYGNVQIIGDGCGLKSGSIYDGRFGLSKLLSRNICHQAIFYRATFARQIGNYNTNYPALADWDFNLRCWAQTKFRYIDITIAKFLVGGISSNGDERFYADLASNVIEYFQFSLLNPMVNSPQFAGLGGIQKMQFAQGKLLGMSGKIMRRAIRCIG
jgi:glycosyltransferase involved in cell wall biosynthesis